MNDIILDRYYSSQEVRISSVFWQLIQIIFLIFLTSIFLLLFIHISREQTVICEKLCVFDVDDLFLCGHPKNKTITDDS